MGRSAVEIRESVLETRKTAVRIGDARGCRTTRRGITLSIGITLSMMLTSVLLVVSGCGRGGDDTDPIADERLRLHSWEYARVDPGDSIDVYLSDPRAAVRVEAIETLGRLQNDAHSARLVRAINDSSAAVREAAFFALGQTGDERAAPPLAARIRRETDTALVCRGLEALGKTGGVAASNGAAAYLSREDPVVRVEACYALGRMEDSIQTAHVVPLLSAAEPSVRAAAAYAIEKSGRAEFAPELVPLYADDSDAVRARAIRAAGKLGERDAVLAGRHLLSDASWRVRVNSARALGEAGGEEAARALLAALPMPTDNENTRVTIVQALGAAGSRSALGALEKIVNGPPGPLTLSALRACARIAGADALPLLAKFRESEDGALREAAWEEGAYVAEREPYAMHLAAFWKTDDVRTRKGIVAGLTRRERPPLDFLIEALEAGDAPTVILAADAIGTHGGPGEREALQRLYWSRGGASTEDGEVRLTALSAWIALTEGTEGADLADPAADSLLRAAVADADERVSREAASFLTTNEIAFAPPERPDTLLAPPFLERPAASTATIETPEGVIRVELFAEVAPVTVRNFATLAASGYYDGLVFHRVVPNFVIQAGCPRGDGWGDPGYAIRCEYNAIRYDAYVMGMALSGKDTGGSQWFITQSPQPHLDGRYTVFGRVIEGFDVVDRTLQGDPIVAVRVEP